MGFSREGLTCTNFVVGLGVVHGTEDEEGEGEMLGLGPGSGEVSEIRL
jgi:hypothetical protein